ncbi:hypothetical protein KIMH_02570 [Bombiscardovia apis]|uniref:CAAX prenyl protease 2/Lysostaphin resistance protein A-like domain-containing protein n=1 Tax=Bombiscardovia apis TaxID=2932182 RepID=A0ABN6SDM4_9BIFI|nr:type II CAAX endopeptidase family protein [Bombiscardovia apis]BDR54146.1 hypothetical protein KIMH_02570 [Bombiscardovia apis]
MRGKHALSASQHSSTQSAVNPAKSSVKQSNEHAQLPAAQSAAKRPALISRALSRPALAQVRQEVSSQAVFVFLYGIAMQLIGYSLGVIIIALQRFPSQGFSSFEQVASNLSGWAAVELYLVATATAFVFTVIYRRSQIEDPGPYGMFHRSRRPMSLSVVVTCLALALAAQSISRFYDFVVRQTVGGIGTSDFSSFGIVGSPSFSAPMVIYSCLWGPIVEEVVFRGAILQGLKRYGKVFAIVTSSLFFALLHGNISQSFFAFILGIVLGFIGCEYSLVWPIALHIVSNIAATYLPNLLRLSLSAQGLRGQALNQTQLVFWFVMVLLGGLALYCSRRSLQAFCLREPQPPNIYAAWGTPWFIVVVVIQLLLIGWRLLL